MKAQNASFLDQFKGKVKDIAVNKTVPPATRSRRSPALR